MTTTQAIDTQKLEQEIAPVIQAAQSITIRTPEDRTAVMDYLRRNKTIQGKIVTFFKDMKEAAERAHKNICSKENSFLTPLKAGEKIAKQKIEEFDDEIERQVRAEQARLQAEEDARAERERQALLKKAKQVKTPAKQEMYRQQAAEVAPNVVTVASPIEKQEGESKRTSWKVTLTSIKELASAASTGNDVALSFLEFNERVAINFAAETAGNIKIPGVIFEKYSTLIIRKR